MSGVMWNASCTVLVISMLTPSATAGSGINWPSFRGLHASGVAEGYATPHQWSIEKNKNIKWKTPIPGLAHSSPVIWGDLLFVTSAVSKQKNPELKVGLYGSGASAKDMTEHRWQVFCLDKRDGRILWSKTAHKGIPRVKRHTKATHANSTPVADGINVVAFFGSEGLYCYSTSGALKWKKDLGTLDAGPYDVPSLQWGFASSPVIDRDRVFVQCDVHGDSFLAAFDLRDGRELWRTPRDEVSTWSTPTVYTMGNNSQLITNGWKHIGGYDLETGKEIWRLSGGGDVPVPTPVVANGLIYITNAHGGAAPLYAIRPAARGDITLRSDATTNEYIHWSTPRNGAYMQTPLVYGEYLYSCSDRGVLKNYEAKTGRHVYRHRLGGGGSGFTASPVAADGKIYFTSEDGDVFVLQAGSEFRILAKNPMGEVCMATPAISEGTLFFRTQHHLVAVADLDGKTTKSHD